MARIGSLVADLQLESAAFRRDLNKATNALNSQTAKMSKAMKGVEKATKGVERQLASMKKVAASAGAALATLGVGLLIRDIVRTSAEFQRLQASLKTVTGSAENADAAFALIKNFAATTPFDLQQVTGAFIKLKALGLDPSEEALRSYGNTAAAIGAQLNQFVEAVADAATGEFERLKEFGIKASSEGEKVTFTFQNASTTVRKSATEIEGFLRGIGNVQFAGAMEEQAKTLGGALSNLSDAASVFKNEIGEGGLADAVADIAREMSAAASGSQNFARSIGANLGAALRGAAEAAKFLGRNMREIAAVIGGLVALKAAGVIFGIAKAMAALATAMIAAAKAGGLLQASMVGAKKGLVGVTVAVAAAVALWEVFDETAGPAIREAHAAVAALANDSNTGVPALNKEVEKSIKANEHQIDVYRGVIQLLEIGAVKHTEVADRLALENEVTRLGVDLTTAQGQAWLRTAREAQRYENRLERLVDVQEANAEAAKEVLRATAEQERELREAMQRPFLNAIDSIQGAFSDTFESIFTGGVSSFTDLAVALRGIFVRLAAEIATLLVFRPAVGGLLTSVGATGIAQALGVAGSGGGSSGIGIPGIPGIGNLFSGVGSAVNAFGFQSGLFGMPAMATPMGFSPAVAGSLTSAPLASVLGVAGLGAFGGSLLAQLTGGNAIGGSVGGGLGAGLGFALGGPIGAAVGGLGGGFLGGLFGGRGGVGPIGHTNIVLSPDGSLRVGTSGVDNGADAAVTIQQAQQAVAQLNALQEQFNLTFSAIAKTGLVGHISQGAHGPGPQSVDAFIGSIFSRGQVSGSGSVATVLANIGADTGLDQITAGLQLAQFIDDMDMSATEKAIRDINKAWDKQIDLAKELGLATGKLVAEKEKEIAAVHAQADAIQAQTELVALNARAQFTQAAGSIVDFVNAQSISATSTLSPTARLAEAQRQFGGLLDTVRGGDINRIGELTRSASNLLTIGRQNFASTVDFANLETFVRSSLLNTADVVGSDKFFADAQVEATRQQTQVLAGELEEVREAVESEVRALRTEIRLLRESLAA